VLLTSKRPESSVSAHSDAPDIRPASRSTRRRITRSATGQSVSSSSPILDGEDDDLELADEEDDLTPPRTEEEHRMWQIGEDDVDDESGDRKRGEQSHESRPAPSNDVNGQERRDSGEDPFGDWEDANVSEAR